MACGTSIIGSGTINRKGKGGRNCDSLQSIYLAIIFTYFMHIYTIKKCCSSSSFILIILKSRISIRLHI